MTLIDIIQQHLKDNDFDGLYNSNLQCGCERDDLMPCGEPSAVCTPGYKRLCDPTAEDCADHGVGPGAWHIQQEKPEVRIK